MKKSKRARRAGLAVGIAVLGTMAFASSAHAVAFGNTFDNGFLKTAFPGNGFDVIEPSTAPGGADPPATLAGDLNLATGAFIIPAGCDETMANPPATNGVGFCFPPFSGEVSGIDIEVELNTTENMTGTAVGGAISPTGAVNANPTDFFAELLVAGDTCTIGDETQDGATPDAVPDMTLTFSTADNSFPNPYDGDLFDVPFHDSSMGDYPPLQNGAVAANWSSLPAAQPGAAGDDCSLINGLIGSPGGLWIAEGLALPAINQPPATPPLTPITVPPNNTNNKQKTKKPCKKKKKKSKGASSAAKGKNCGKKKKKKK